MKSQWKSASNINEISSTTTPTPTATAAAAATVVDTSQEGGQKTATKSSSKPYEKYANLSFSKIKTNFKKFIHYTTTTTTAVTSKADGGERSPSGTSLEEFPLSRSQFNSLSASKSSNDINQIHHQHNKINSITSPKICNKNYTNNYTIGSAIGANLKSSLLIENLPNRKVSSVSDNFDASLDSTSSANFGFAHERMLPTGGGGYLNDAANSNSSNNINIKAAAINVKIIPSNMPGNFHNDAETVIDLRKKMSFLSIEGLN
jgi:hypothetical protein